MRRLVPLPEGSQLQGRHESVASSGQARYSCDFVSIDSWFMVVTYDCQRLVPLLEGSRLQGRHESVASGRRDIHVILSLACKLEHLSRRSTPTQGVSGVVEAAVLRSAAGRGDKRATESGSADVTRVVKRAPANGRGSRKDGGEELRAPRLWRRRGSRGIDAF